MELAPIVLFTFNRPEHTRKTVEALQKNQFAAGSDLFIFSDGATNKDTEADVKEVRRYIHTIGKFRSVSITERDRNYGLAANIIDGVTRIMASHKRIIVLEDDLLTSPFFLKFMNEALETYENKEEVLSIHGYIYPVKKPVPPSFFLIDPGSLGWATWQNRWAHYEADGTKLLKELRAQRLTSVFDYDDTFVFTKMLIDQVEGRNSSWVIRWYAYALLNQKFTLYPGRSLVFHMGNDGSGTHEGKTDVLDVELSDEPIPVIYQKPGIHQEAREAFKHYFRSVRGNLLRRAFKKIIKIIRATCY